MRTRQKCVATDTWRSLGCRTTPLEHWSRRKPTVEPRWAKQQTKKLRPKPTKINSFMSGPSLSLTPDPPACNYPANCRKNTPPYIEYLSHLSHPRHLSLHTCTHFTLLFITYPNLHFPTLYFCQSLIKYKAETTYQIRPKRPRTEKTQAETTQGRNDSGLKRTTRECSCGCRTGTYM